MLWFFAKQQMKTFLPVCQTRLEQDLKAYVDRTNSCLLHHRMAEILACQVNFSGLILTVFPGDLWETKQPSHTLNLIFLPGIFIQVSVSALG